MMEPDRSQHPSQWSSVPTPTESHWLGEPELMVPCSTCATSAVTRQRVVVTALDNPAWVMLRGQFWKCVACGDHGFERDSA